MDEQLKEAVVRLYGNQCEKHLDVIDERIGVMLAALLFAGEIGDNPLCVLNRAFENTKR